MDGLKDMTISLADGVAPDLPRILLFLGDVRRRWFRISFVRVMLLWVALMVLCGTMVCLTAGKVRVTEGVRWGLLGVWLASVCAGPAFFLWLIVFRQPSDLTLANLAEKAGGVRHNDLINALQLAQDPFWSPSFVTRIVSESARAVDGLHPDTVFSGHVFRGPLLVLAGGMLLSGIILAIGLGTVGAGFSALMKTNVAGEPHDSPNSADSILPGTNFDPEKILRVQITGRFPVYHHRRPELLVRMAGPLTIPEGTELEFIAEGTQRVERLQLGTRLGDKVDFQTEAGTLRYQCTWRPANDDEYHLTARLGPHALRWPTGSRMSWPVKMIKDAPPTVRIAQPGEDVELPPGAEVRFAIVAEDDYELTDVSLFVDGKKIHQVSPGKAKSTANVSWRIPNDATIASLLSYQAIATDNRSLPGKGPQRTATRKFTIRVVSPQKYAETATSAEDSLREQVQAILKKQIHLRSKTIAKDTQGLAPGQTEIKRDLGRLADRPLPAGLADAGRTLSRLAKGPAADAEMIARQLESPERFKRLAEVQEEIILTLESVLQMLQRDNTPEDKPATATMPADSNSMEQLSELLGKFVDQERLALRTTQDLAGKTPEDFTAQDKAALEDLKQLQEKWDRFLQQAVDDMNKLAKQDFSAAVAKDELVEVQGQVKLAEDAMKRQAMTLAVKEEEISLELAKELLHNLERWLENAPDRTKWDLQEPSEPIDVPLAELPEELEDIVGDLIEQEEDMYDEIEDVTSSWADSLDIGAGWQVSDGPMSNFSAKGITGNVLPNKNEVSGRSGEGRSGRSSGEFVEKTARGKGGRRTPTRLTKDALQSGQIEDKSQEPAGGATGGGKLSGAGAEGLTGPRPKQPMPNLPALRDKQALLLSKAKMAQWQARKNEWGNFQLDKVVRLMAQNKTDMDKGAYQSVLARRNVLIASLKTSRTLLASKFQLDPPEAKWPKQLQSQLRSMDPETVPENLQPLLTKYYELLAQPGNRNKTP